MAISFFPQVVIRSPAWSFPTTPLTEQQVLALSADEGFLNALLVASPTLYAQVLKWKKGKIADPRQIEKIMLTLSHYAVRMQTRCTPFGLFSGCGLSSWGAAKTLQRRKEMNFELRLDTYFLASAARHIEQHPLLKRQLLYTLNSTYYIRGEALYYYAYQERSGKKVYALNSVLRSAELQVLMDHCTLQPMSWSAIVKELAKLGHNAPEALDAYVEELVAEEILHSSLLPNLNEDWFEQMCRELDRTETTNTNDRTLHALRTGFKRIKDLLNEARPASLALIIEKIKGELDQLNFAYDSARLFSVNSFLDIQDGHVDIALQEQLGAAVDALHLLSAAYSGDALLNTLKERFEERFDQQQIPLVHLTDPEIGILTDELPILDEYGAAGLQELIGTPLPADSGKKTLKLDYLAGKALAANLNQAYNLVITDADLEHLRTIVTVAPLPATFPVVFQALHGQEATLYVEHAGGPTGTMLFSRFGHHQSAYRTYFQEIADYEQSVYPDAEVVSMAHIPEDRIANIASQLPGRKHQLSYYAGAGNATTVTAGDLGISLSGRRFRITNQRTGREVIPRIDHAHNFQSCGLPLYQLWGRLQSDGQQTNLSLPAKLPGLKFFPRVTYRKTILKAASWFFERSDYVQFIPTAPETPCMTALRDFLQKWSVPAQFLLAEGDQTLYFDQSNPYSIELFLKTIKNRPTLMLVEYLGGSAGAVQDAEGRKYQHQFIATAKYTPIAMSPPAAQVLSHTVRRNYLPGEEWLYFKIFLNKQHANLLLERVIKPFCEEQLQRDTIKTWFYIRYDQPADHIRLRMRLGQNENFAVVLHTFRNTVAGWFAEKEIWKLQIENYVRELERYPLDDYDALEQLFGVDSQFCVALLHWWNTRQASFDLVSIAIKITDDIYNLHQIGLQDKLRLSIAVSEGFFEEFQIGRKEKKSFSTYFREHRSVIRQRLDGGDYADDPALNAAYHLWIEERGHLMKKFAQQTLEPRQQDLFVTDLIHLFYNRLFHDRQRVYEMMGHAVLVKAYLSLRDDRAGDR